MRLNHAQDALDDDIEHFNQGLSALADEAVQDASDDEQTLLWVSIILTLLAFLLAAIFTWLVTKVLLRSVHNLVQGTVAIQAGDFESKVDVTSKDEMATLTVAFNDMADGLLLKERIHETFGQYMDPRIVQNLLDHPTFSQSGGQRCEMTVFVY